jgi:hypothetical protein
MRAMQVQPITIDVISRAQFAAIESEFLDYETCLSGAFHDI